MLVPVKKIVHQLLVDHMRSPNAHLAVSSAELAARAYQTKEEQLSRAQLSATRRGLSQLFKEGSVKRIADHHQAFWICRPTSHAVARRPHLSSSTITPQIDRVQVSLLGQRHRQSAARR
jgi:hypothetical protein